MQSNTYRSHRPSPTSTFPDTVKNLSNLAERPHGCTILATPLVSAKCFYTNVTHFGGQLLSQANSTTVQQANGKAPQ